jgi:hypothetical protein
VAIIVPAGRGQVEAKKYWCGMQMQLIMYLFSATKFRPNLKNLLLLASVALAIDGAG